MKAVLMEDVALQRHRRRVVDLEEADAGLGLADGAGVEPGAEQHDLAAAGGDLPLEHVVEVAGADLHQFLDERETGGGLGGGAAAGGAEEQADDVVAIERIDGVVLLGAVLGDDEGGPGDVGHRVGVDGGLHDRDAPACARRERWGASAGRPRANRASGILRKVGGRWTAHNRHFW
jgi:hypothetical protein